MCILINWMNKYNKTYHSTIKMEPIDTKANTYIDFNKKNNKEDLKFEVDDHVRASKYKIFSQIVTFKIGLKKFL